MPSPPLPFLKRRRRAKGSSVLPQIVSRIFQHDIDTVLTITVVEEVLDHGVVLADLLFIPRAGFGDDPANVAHRTHQLLLNGLFERLITLVRHLLATTCSCPQIGN